jgi:multiple antibiotic resistance protein
MTGLAQHFTHVFFLVYAGLFPIVNPVGNAPIFLALTRYYTERERHALALRVAVNGFFLLLGSLLVGSYVLEFFGITLPVLRIAGGVVVTAFGWTLLQGSQELGNQRTAEAAQGSDGDAFYPLTCHSPLDRELSRSPLRSVANGQRRSSISLILRCSLGWPLPASRL